MLFVLWAYLMIAATSNGVNLTDGLDGLATGTSVMVLAAYVIIAFWEFGNSCVLHATQSSCYQTRDPLDLALVAGGRDGRVLRLPVVERRRRRASSWVTPARWRSAACSAGSPS